MEKKEHLAFTQAEEILKRNDFSQNYINKMLEKMRNEFPTEKLDDPDTVQEQLLEWIGETISIYKDDAAVRKPRIMVLVGPTGAGKTTTIAKLAASYGIESDENNVRVVEVRIMTIDNFCLCGKEQLEKIGDITLIPVSCVGNKKALKKEIAVHSENTDMFLIDTVGRSYKDEAELSAMKKILEGAGIEAEFYLVISANTKTSSIEDIMRQFERFKYKSVIITKMDEADRIGNVISALAEKGKTISYITDGQEIPVHIRKASAVHFLINLDGFKADCEKLKKRFPPEDADQFGWKTSAEKTYLLKKCSVEKKYKKWLEAIKIDHNALLEVPRKQWTNELCLAAVQRDYAAIHYLTEENLTKEICLEAYRQSPTAIRYVPENLREIYRKFVEKK